jgi:ComF family protein
MLKTLSDSFLSVLYPEECRVCGGEVDSLADGVACSNCWSATKIFTGDETLCSKCGAFLFDGVSHHPTFCHKCDDQDFDIGAAAASYEKAMAASVLSLKKTPRLFSRVKTLLTKTTDRIADRNSDIIIPVPLSPRRLRERGFNQAAIIGKAVSKQLGIPMDEATLARRIDTPMHRAGMDRKARGMTVKNAFTVSRPKLIAEKNILLVDDVLTSGETVSSCARILKKNGAARVDVITLARAV